MTLAPNSPQDRCCPGQDQTGQQGPSGQRGHDKAEYLELVRPLHGGGFFQLFVDPGKPYTRGSDEKRNPSSAYSGERAPA